MFKKSGITTVTAAVALCVLLLGSCCKHEETHMSTAISMGIAQNGTKAVISSTGDLISQYFETGGVGFGVYGYKNVTTNSTQYRLFNNVEVYPTNNDADNPDWTYQPTRYWDSNPNANYHFIAYWPHLGTTQSNTEPYVSESGETLTIHNIPNWQPTSTGYDYMLAEPRIGRYKEFPFDANPDVKVRFTFSHLLAKVEFRAYYVGAESDITVNQITLLSPDENTPAVLQDGGSTNVSRLFDGNGATNVFGTPGSGQSKDIMTGSVVLPDSVFFDESSQSQPKYQKLCSWFTFPCSYWNNLNLSVNYSISRSPLTGTSQGLTLQTPVVNDNPLIGVTKPGYSYVVTLKFTISSGIEIESIQVNDWIQGTPSEPEVYNW